MNFVETIAEKEWVAEFEAPNHFNLHIERENSGSLVVGQRGTASGEYDTSFVKGMYEGQRVIDYDFGACVRHIRLVDAIKWSNLLCMVCH